MNDNKKTRKQLIEELEQLRQQNNDLKNQLVVNADSDVTAGKHSPEESRLHEIQLRLIYASTDTPLFFLKVEPGPHYVFLNVNPSFLKATGLREEQIVGKTTNEVIPKSSQMLVHSNYLKAIREKRIISWEESSQYPTGLKTGIVSIVPVFDDRGSCTHLVGSVQNITERKQANDELLRYKCIVSSSSDMIALLNNDFVYLAANDKYLEPFGLTRSELIGATVTEVFGEPFFEKIIRPNAEKCLRGTIVSFNDIFDFPVIGKRHMEISYYPYYGQNNEIEGFVVNGRDITERKLAEEKAVRWAAFAMNNPAPVLRTDLDGRITLINPAGIRLFARDATGERIMSVLPDTVDMFSYPSADKMPLHVEQKLEDEIYLFGLKRDESTSSIYIYGSNITEIKRLHALESRAQKLELAGTIAGQVAHDFNNLLAPMMAYPEFIREELPNDNEAHAYLDAIEEAATKIAEINQDLLTMGRRGHYSQKVINLNKIILQVVQELKSQTKTVTCKMDLCEDLLEIKGGNAQIHRILSNLLSNARDAMEGAGQITIRSENYYADDTSVASGRIPDGEYVKLTVSDTGSGIPEDIVQRIFEPFFTSKTADKERGSGLGLSVVDAVIKDHNGYLDLSSKVGHGTSFYLYFPITREEASKSEPEHLAGGTETVLVVDDDSIQREVSSRLLRKLGYQVASVKSGEKAIEFLRKNSQDIVILDMVMPGGIDGAETFRQIIEINPHQKAIILSGLSETDRVLEAQKMGAGAFVRKPVSIKVIAAAVRTELDKQAKVLS